MLSPSIMQVDTKHGIKASALSKRSRCESQTRKNSASVTDCQHPKVESPAINYGNLVQTKAQKLAQHPDLAYVKRDTANDKIAKASA